MNSRVFVVFVLNSFLQLSVTTTTNYIYIKKKKKKKTRRKKGPVVVFTKRKKKEKKSVFIFNQALVTFDFSRFSFVVVVFGWGVGCLVCHCKFIVCDSVFAVSLPFLSVFDVLFAVFLALFPQATNLVYLNHMHSDGGGWGVGDEEEEKRRERESLPIYSVLEKRTTCHNHYYPRA